MRRGFIFLALKFLICKMKKMDELNTTQEPLSFQRPLICHFSKCLFEFQLKKSSGWYNHNNGIRRCDLRMWSTFSFTEKENSWTNHQDPVQFVLQRTFLCSYMHTIYCIHSYVHTCLQTSRHRDLEGLCKSPGVALILVQPLGLMGQRIFVEWLHMWKSENPSC